jgi:hypothetical protein
MRMGLLGYGCAFAAPKIMRNASAKSLMSGLC